MDFSIETKSEDFMNCVWGFFGKKKSAFLPVFYFMVLPMFGVSVNLFPSLPNFASCPEDLWVAGLEIFQINMCIKSVVTPKKEIEKGE